MLESTLPRPPRSVALPNELVLIIFCFALPRVETVEDLKLLQLHRRSILGVCRQWMNCLAGTPAFWDTIYVSWPACRSVVALWAKRSDLNPLRIHLAFPPAQSRGINFAECFDHLQHMFARCWLLSISADFDASAERISSVLATTSFPILKRFLVQNFTPSCSRNILFIAPLATSGVQSMYLSRCRITWNAPPVFAALTTLVISNTTMSYEPAANDFAQLCKCAPALVRLEFFNVRCVNAGINAWWPLYVELVHLRHLRVSFLPGAEGNRLALQLMCFDAPNLSTLYLDADPNHLLQMVSDRPRFLKHVKELRLKLRSSHCELLEFFELLPALARLDVLHQHSPIFKALAPHNTVAHLCPLLHTVSVTCGPDLAGRFLFRRLWAGIPLQRVYYKEVDGGAWASWIRGTLAKSLSGERWDGYRDDIWSQRSSIYESLRYSGLTDAYFKRISVFNIKTSSIPFNFLATEILAEILLLVPTPFHERPRDYKRTVYHLATVSRAFRTSTCDPRFWSYVYVDESSDLVQIPKQLARCGAAPLSIYLGMLPSVCADLPWKYTAIEEGNATYAPIAESDIIRSRYVERWTAALELLSSKLLQCRHFYVHTTCETRTRIIFEVLSNLDGSAISCLYLDIQPASLDDQRISPLPVLFDGKMPGLQGIILREAFVCGLMPVATSVTRLALWADTSHWKPTVQELFDLLRAMPSLINLSISNIPFDDIPAGYANNHAIELSAVTELFFCGYDDTSFAAFGCIRMPVLRTLNLVIAPEEVDQFLHSWRASTLNISALALEFTSTPSVGTFATLLSAFPKLELLDCRRCLYIGLHINAMVLYWSDLCPVLRDLWLDEDLHDRVLTGILEHASSGGFGPDLRLVTLRGHDLEGSVTIPYESKLKNGNLESKPAGILRSSLYTFNYLF
ncbi:hypothetical protein B0H16DRAFT_1447882 [Mycena metata]|uniref:F-box domain-containing protein n=1 Tax=Mycena metata TaxID=1033252 RepID=A0AAD7KEE8_9AGAR|nr:hypothetical protein B0H16DRAFT_1447882 [Mycena metata]